MAYTTFEQFQATRKEATVADLALIGVDSGAAGYTYADGGCYIEIANGEFYLCIYNEQWSSEVLADLEAKLFVHFYIGEQFDGMLKNSDGSLDDYVLAYCKARGIECEDDRFAQATGEAFGQIGEAGISPRDASAIIERAVKDSDAWSNVEPSAVRTVVNPDITAARAAKAAADKPEWLAIPQGDVSIIHSSPPCESFAKPAASEELPVAQYKREFPDFDYVIPTIYGLKDSSWSNDVCPCFEAKEFGLQVWFDYADHAKREFPDDDLPQFSLRRVDAAGDLTDILSSISLLDVLTKFYETIAEQLPASDRRDWFGKAYKETVGYDPFEDSEDMTVMGVVILLAGVIYEDYSASNEAPEWPDTTEMVDAITAAEVALKAGQINVAGNDKTEGDEADEETIFFAPLVLCRNVLADVEKARAYHYAPSKPLDVVYAPAAKGMNISALDMARKIAKGEPIK